MARLSPILLAMCLLASCGGKPAPTPDAIGTQVALAQAVAGTLTAAVPTATATPVPTFTNTATATAILTATPTPTWTATATPAPTLTQTPTPAPTLTPTSKPTARPRPTSTPVPELVVTYRDLHYECQGNTVWTRGRPPYGSTYGYRSFQTLMVITNQTSDKTVSPPWIPDKWIVTNGTADREDAYAWQWVAYAGAPTYPQPPIGPGATASWTWMCYPLNPGEWVKAAEFTAWGHTYRFEFPKPSIGDFNYYDCP